MGAGAACRCPNQPLLYPCSAHSASHPRCTHLDELCTLGVVDEGGTQVSREHVQELVEVVLHHHLLGFLPHSLWICSRSSIRQGSAAQLSSGCCQRPPGCCWFRAYPPAACTTSCCCACCSTARDLTRCETPTILLLQSLWCLGWWSNACC